MVSAPSFKLYDVTKGEYFQSDTIPINSEYGGVHWTLGGQGRRSTFSLPIANHDLHLLDNTKNNGLRIENRDEIQLLCTSPSHNLVDQLVFHGYVLKAARTISQNNDKVVRLSGISFFDFWNESRYFERDYTKRPDTVNNIAFYALERAHPNLALDPTGIPANNTLVYKRWIGCSPSDVLLELAAAYNQEFFVSPTDRAEMFAYGSEASGYTFDETDILHDGELYHSSEDSHYDEIKFMTNNPYFAPNHATPTTTSFTDNVINYTLRDPDDLNLLYFAGIWLDPAWNLYTTERASTATNVFKGPLSGGAFQTIGFGRPGVSQIALVLHGPDFAGNPSTLGLGLLEADFEVFSFILWNYFAGVTEFRIRLTDLHYDLEDNEGYWESRDLSADLSAGVGKQFTLFLPNHEDVELGFWNVNGAPTKIDTVQFIFRGGTYNIPSFITNIYFQGMVRATATIASPPDPTRQKVIIDKTISDIIDARNIANAELAKLQDPAVIGRLSVEGNPLYNKPGQTAIVDFPYDGFDSIDARIDAITHDVTENEYSSTISFAPLLVKNSLWNRLSEISLRENPTAEENMANVESRVANLDVS